MRVRLRTFAQGLQSACIGAKAHLVARTSCNSHDETREADRALTAFKEQEKMKSLRTISLLALVAIMVASVASAAPTISVRVALPDGAEFWDDAQVHPNQQRDLVVILGDVAEPINAVEYKINLPQNVLVLGNTYGFDGAVDFGGGHTGSGTGSAIGFGDCYPASSVNDQVVHSMRIMAVGAFARQEITVTAFEGGGDVAAAPRYNSCSNVTVSLVPSSTWLESTTAVDAGDSSWGAVKALY